MKRRTVESSTLSVDASVFPHLQPGINSTAARLSIRSTDDGFTIERGQDIVLDPPVMYHQGDQGEFNTWLETLLQYLSGGSHLDHPEIPNNYFHIKPSKREDVLRDAIKRELLRGNHVDRSKFTEGGELT